MDFMDNYVDFADKMQRTIDGRKRVAIDDEDYFNMVNQEISAEDIGEAFRKDKIKILIKSEADEADLFSDEDNKFTFDSR